MNAVTPERIVISVGINAKYKHPMPAAVDEYESRVGSYKVFCTNRHGTVKVYGRFDGGVRVYKQFRNNKDCTYNVAHY